MLFMMPIAGALVTRIDPRFMMAMGFLGTAAAMRFIGTHLSLQMDFRTAFLLRTFQAAGLAFIFLPSNTLAYVGIPREKNNQISAMNSFVRNIGGSIGIAMITTLITRQAAKHQNYMVAHTTPGSPAFQQMASGLSHTLAMKGVPQPLSRAYAMIAEIVSGQATTMAYIDVISGMALVIVFLTPLVLIMRRPKAGAAAAAMH
jgi:DHA2 family multidrug resistance protein